MTQTLIKAFKREFAMELFQKYPTIAVEFYEQLIHIYNFLESYVEMCNICSSLSLRCNYNFANFITKEFICYSEFVKYFYICYVYININRTPVEDLLTQIDFISVLKNLYDLYCIYFNKEDK